MLGLISILPLLIGWVGCFWLVRELARLRHIEIDWRIAWMFACLGFGLVLTLIVEISSLANALGRPMLAILWTGSDVIILWGAFRLRKCAGTATAQSEPGESRLSFGDFPLDAKLLLAATTFIVLFLFFVALLTPTTNIDSLSYHLARMAHWIQQSNVNHYATDDLRQLEFGPWSSFVMTNLFLLWGNDRLLNLAQWFAMFSSLIVLSWIAQRLSILLRADTDPSGRNAAGEARTVAFTCLVAATLPIGLVESISTQNDYSTAFWVLSIFALALLLMKEPANGCYVFGVGLAAGLGALTKATTYMYAGPLILTGGLWWLRRLYLRERARNPETGAGAGLRNRLASLQLPCLFAGTFFLLTGPHMARNYVLFGSPLGSPEMLLLERNERISPQVAASNLIRNTALHTNSGIPWLTRGLNSALAGLHQFTGEALNDPATTFSYCAFEFRQKFTVSDSVASCLVHLFLCGVACVLLFRYPLRNRRILLYLAPTLASFVFFIFFLKWQLWHSRIHLLWFLLFAPVVAIALCNRKTQWPAWGGAVLLFIFAICTVLSNSSRPIFNTQFLKLPREKQYFTPIVDTAMRDSFVHLTERIIASKSQAVGLKAGFCGIEYPLWIMLRNRGFEGRLDRCFVENVSAQITPSAPPPDVILTIFDVVPEAISRSYPHSEKVGPLTVLWKQRPDSLMVESSH